MSPNSAILGGRIALFYLRESDKEQLPVQKRIIQGSSTSVPTF